MSALSIIHAILSDDVPVMVDVAGRINPVVHPEAEAFPGLVLHLVRSADEITLSGQDGYPEAPFIVDCVALTFGEADALGGKVKAALVDYRGTIAGADVSNIALDDLDHFDRGEPGNIWRRRLGFRIRYRAAA